MLHYNVVMKVTMTRKASFPFITMDLIVRLKVLIINKSKDSDHKYQ